MRDPDDGNRMNVVIFARKGCARNLSNAFFPFSCRKKELLKRKGDTSAPNKERREKEKSCQTL